MHEIKRLYIAYQKAAAESDRLDKELEAIIDTGANAEELTRQWDEAYRKCFDAFKNLIEAVHKVSGIDKPTIKKMIHMKRFEALMDRIT